MFVGGEKVVSAEGTTQGDPLAMALYAVAVTPLIRRVQQEGAKQIWFADDAASGGKLLNLRRWWNSLNHHGPMFGYFVNSSKTWLVAKRQHLDSAKEIFRDTGVKISTEGKRHLGGALGDADFVTEYVQEQVGGWIAQVDRLASIAQSQPQCAYAAFRHSLASRWTFMARTVEGIGELFEPLEAAIRERFIPALMGQEMLGDAERQLFALPTRLGGLGLTNPTLTSTEHWQASRSITAPLVALIVQQTHSLGSACEEIIRKRSTIRLERRKQQRQAADHIRQILPATLQRCMELAQEKGASTWLEALPVKEHGFNLSRNEFRDGLCMRYGWKAERLPNTCCCGASFDTAHALSCPTGAIPTIRHNEIRDVVANILSEMCADVDVEPELPLTGNEQDGKRLDIKARGFWGGRFEETFLTLGCSTL